VCDPETGLPFTEAGAWDFVANLLESGHPVELVVLEKPPGATGYVLKKQVTQHDTIYIKLRIRAGCVIGRSFHYSIY
jgi:hypothetical protein